MNTKEAIYFLEHEVKLFPHEAKSLPACLEIYKVAERIGEIVELLERGEKYKEMIDKQENVCSAKPIRKTITIDIESKNEIDVKWFLDRFNSFNAQIVVDLPYTKIKTKVR